MPFPEFKFFGEVIQEETELFIGQQSEIFKKFINAQKIIRCYIQGGPGYGHQSASVNMIRRFSEDPSVNPLGCGFAGTIEIWVEEDDDKQQIFELIPEFKGKDEGILNKSKISIASFGSKAPEEGINFGFCGACDFIDADYSYSMCFLQGKFQKLKVRTFLMLQPYKWFVKMFAPNQLSPGNVIFYWKLEEKKPVLRFINLDTGEDCKVLDRGKYETTINTPAISTFHIADRGFNTIVKDLTTSDWIIISENSPERIRPFLIMLKTLLSPDNISKYNIVPIYGINHPGETQFREPVSHRIALIMASFQTALRNGAEIKPPIIINFGSFDPGDNFLLEYNQIIKLATGDNTLKEIAAAALLVIEQQQLSPEILSTEKIRSYRASLRIGQYRRNSLFPGMGEFFAAFDYKKITDISTLLQWIDERANRVLFIQGDRVSPSVFNYILKKASLPPIFEGNNTALPAIAAGKPYFHLCDPGSIGIENRYPPGIVGEQDSSAIRNKIQKAANEIQSDFDEWPEQVDNAANVIINREIIDIYPDNKGVFDYFGSVSEFFAKPVNDKIHICSSLMAMFGKQIFSTDEKFMLTDEQPLLENLYNQIKAEIDKNATVNILQDILPSGGIHDNFTSLLKLSGGQLIVDKASVTAHKDDKSQIDKVTLKGETQAFGVKTECTFIFTLQMDKIACNGSFTAEEPWSLDEIPWIVFKKPTFNTLSSDADLPSGGSISAILQGPEVEISLALPDSSGRAVAKGNFEKPVSIAGFMSFVGGVNINEYVPEPIQKLANIGVKDVEFAYNIKSNAIEYISLDIGSPDSWSLLDRLKVENATVRVTVNSPGDLNNRSVTAALAGELLIGTDEKAPRIDLSATIPTLQLSGQLASKELPLNTLMGVFWPGVSPPWPGGKEPAITELSVSYNGTSGDYMVDTTMDLHWPIDIAGTNVLTINYISLHLMGGKKWANGNLSGSFAILPDGPNIGLLLIASFLGKDAGWRFEAQQTSGVVDIADLLKKYLSWETELSLGVDGLSLKVETRGPSFEFSGKTAKAWHIPIGTGIDIIGTMKIGYNGGSEHLGVPEKPTGNALIPVLGPDNAIILEMASDDEKIKGYFGQISAEIKWNGIDLTVFGNFTPVKTKSGTTYELAFGISWGSLTGMIEEKMIDGKKHQIASLTFKKSTTLGSMIESMVAWATGSKFSLGAPWNILDKIPLSNFALEYDFTDETVKLKVNIGPINLGFVTIKSIGLAYDKDPDDPEGKKRVMVDLDASFIWGEEIKPWDATKPETTPSPRGSGNKYLDLRMLAMGQHVTFDGYKDVESVQKAIELMEKMPEPDPEKPESVFAVTFDPNSSWLFGTDFGVLKIVPPKKESENAMIKADNAPAAKEAYVLTLQIIFNDPHLYALRIAMAGDAAKIFKGLDFQIMYKKLSENLGVYKAEITLPDKMRYIKAGSFNITLPVFGIEIYTNGDFKIDIGFPWNEDFTRSFSICGIIMAGPIPVPLTGAGGLYFGKVPQIAASNVPQATNGHFNPILVFGFGAQLGLGYEIHYGILNAGFSLTMFGILEGLLAKWNPYDGKSSGNSDGLQIQGEYFFWIRGTFGIIGKIFGNVDFVVIKAEVDITLKIYAQITFASYEPIPITIVASVEASASLTINLGLFKIHLHFSFSVRIKETIKIDAAQGKAPWQVEEVANQGRLESPMSARLSGHNLALFSFMNEDPWTPHWGSLSKPKSGHPAQLTGYMSFALTVAGDLAYNKDDPPDLKKQVPCYVASMFIDSVPAAKPDDFSSESKALGKTSDTSFEILAKLVAVWAIASLTDKSQTPEQVFNSIVSEVDLKKLENYFYDTMDHPTPIPAESISTFLANQVLLTVSMPKESGEADAAYFPMALPLSLERLAYGETPPVNYSLEEYNAIDSDFISWLREYFNQLAVQVQKETGQKTAAILLDSNSDISVGNFVFTDYFLLIMRQMIKAMLEGLRTFKRSININESCNDIVSWVTETGKLDKGVFTLHDIFEGNSTYTLNTNLTLVIPSSAYTVKDGDSFKSIAENKKFNNAFDGSALAEKNANTPNLMASGKTITYNKTIKHDITGSETLNSLAENVFKVSLDELLANSDIIDGKNLLESFACITLPDYTYTTVANDTINSVVAAHGITIAELAGVSKNGDIKGLFPDKDDSKPLYLNLVHLPQFNVQELLNEAQRSKALEHLSCMVSRYYFHGMRLPTDKITPKHEGMWVTKDGTGKLHLPPEAGLFALTGQQIAVPVLTKDPLTLSVARPKTDLDWLTFEKDVEKLTLTIEAPSADVKKDGPTVNDYNRIMALYDFATNNVLDTGLTYIGTERMVFSKEAVYPLSSSVPCQSTARINYPAGGTLDDDKPRLWYIPDAIMSLFGNDTQEADPCPCFNLETHQYNEATGATISSELTHYGWATSIEFTIKRLPQTEIKGAYQNTYEIAGAGGKQVLLLERLVQAVKDNDNLFSDVIVSYNTGSDKDSVLRTETGPGVTLGISQVNLSTVTRPPSSGMMEFITIPKDDSGNLLNKPSQFVRLLWEACITRAGGFYLYYNEGNGESLPDSIFNDKNEANVTLLVIHRPIENDQLQNYMNSVLIGDPINLQNSAVVAQTISSNVTHAVGVNESLYSIAMRYYSNVLSIEERNSEIKLTKGAEITISNGTYLVTGSAPGGKLADIADYFQIAEEEIKKANPRIDAKAWAHDLDTGVPIRLPKTKRTVGTHPGGEDMQSIAQYYGTSSAAIVGENRFMINLLAIGQQLNVATGPLNLAGTNPPDVQTIGARRSALPPFPDDPTDKDYAKNYLLYLYTMLGYTIDGNQDFLESNIGLPLGPKGKPATDDMEKIRAVKQTNGTEPLEYSKSIHYAKMLSDGHKKPVADIKPYESNGRLLQINYCWQDLYGNRIVSRLDQKAQGCIDTKSPILTGYTDILIGFSQWQSMSAHWTVGKSASPGKTFLLKTIISFDPSAYLKPDDPSSQEWQHNAFTSLATYNTLLDQLNDPNGIGFWFETSLTSNPVPVPNNQIFQDSTSTDPAKVLVNWLTAIRDFLQACCEWQSGPAPTPPGVIKVTLQAEVDKTELNKKQLYKLTFQLIIGRTEGVAEGDFVAIPAVQKSATPITPITNERVDSKTEDDEPTKPELQQFTSDIESTLSLAKKYKLTVATGEDRQTSSYNKTTNVWAVQLGEIIDHGISYSIPNNVAPQIFAPMPISNKLVTKSADVFDYSSPDSFDPKENKFTGVQHTLTFTDIELDKWVRQLFTEFDNLLSPEFTSSILIIDKKTNAHPSGVSNFMDSFNEQKKSLASVAKELMNPVYEQQESTRLESAKEALYQELLEKLSNLYSTRAAVSFGAKVNADILNDNSDSYQTPQLYGNITWQNNTTEAQSQVVLTSPKLNLKNSDDTPLTFLVEAPTQLKSDTSVVLPSLTLALSYKGTAIEHQISEVPGIKDYKASTWLGFVNPVTAAQKLDTQLSSFEIPMFIRSFPLSPRMDVQTGNATITGAGSLSDLTKWDYTFSYAQDFHYIQDRIYGKVEYNIRDNTDMTLAGFMDAFNALAQFYSMKDTVQQLLKETVSGIDTSSSQENIDKASKVLGAYLKMVSEVASRAQAAGSFGLNPYVTALRGDDNTYEFYIEESEATFKPDGQKNTITAWVVTIVSENKIPPTGLSSNPYIEIEGSTHQGIKVLTNEKEGIYAYWFKQKDTKPLIGKDAQVIQKRTMVMPGMHILQRQDAKSSTYIKRNVELVKGHPSNNSFIYKTPEVTFSNPLHPTISTDRLIDISDINNPGGNPRTIKDHLTALFAELFKGSRGAVTLQVESYYGYSPNKDITGISVLVPILMQPPLTVIIEKKTESGPAGQNPSMGEMADQLSAGILYWFTENKPGRENGAMRFKLSVMSNLTLQPMPILNLTKLYLEIKDVKDLK